MLSFKSVISSPGFVCPCKQVSGGYHFAQVCDGGTLYIYVDSSFWRAHMVTLLAVRGVDKRRGKDGGDSGGRESRERKSGGDFARGKTTSADSLVPRFDRRQVP